MGFNGLILSDAMEMKAVQDLFGLEDGTLRALNAGIDIALICHSPQRTADALEHVARYSRDGRFSEENVNTHFERIAACKNHYALPEGEPAFGTPDQKKLAEAIMDASVTLLHAPEGKPLPALSADTLFFGTLARRNALVNDDIPLNAAQAFAGAFGGRYGGLTPEENPDTAVVFLGRHPDAEKTLACARRMAKNGVKLVAVSLWTPRMLSDLPDSVWKIAAWQYDDLAVGSLIRMYGKI